MMMVKLLIEHFVRLKTCSLPLHYATLFKMSIDFQNLGCQHEKKQGHVDAIISIN